MISVNIIPLGGSSEVTRNMFAYEYRINGQVEDILLVDCGIGFPDESMLGIDYLIPDITYLKDKLKKIRGLVLTHGHMDHIGALKFLLPKLRTRVYATRLTAALAEVDLREVGLKDTVRIVEDDEIIILGSFRVAFIHVSHSIPDAANLVIATPVGVFYHGSDYKFDWQPVDGKPTEVYKIVRAAGEKGVLCLLSDCVRSENTGYTLSEKIIEESLLTEVKKTRGKFLFATFSSNISRIQQAINAGLANGRKLFFAGRSMRKNIEVAKRLKYLHFPQSQVVVEKQLAQEPGNKLLCIVTGSQGEPGSVLARLANDEYQYLSLSGGDTIVLSADPIPGNEQAVNKVINLLSAQGGNVVYTDIHDELHVSGHGSQGDLALMIGLTRPKFIVPIGGEYKQMVQLRKLAMEMGYRSDDIFILKTGQVLSFDEVGRAVITQAIETHTVMVDGLRVGDVGTYILRDRQQLAQEGFVVVVVPYEVYKGELAGEIDIVTRGFVFHKEKETEALLARAKKRIYGLLEKRKGRAFDWPYVRSKITENLEQFFISELDRKPLILPVVIEV